MKGSYPFTEQSESWFRLQLKYRNLVLFCFLIFLSQSLIGQPGLTTILEIRGGWNETLGGKVLALGDMNGDSLPDIGISASGFRKFYVYYGGKGVLDDIPDAEFPGGFNACVCDINGDGRRDLISVSNQNSYDTAWVFFGIDTAGLRLERRPSLILVSDKRQGGQDFGWYMACGDLNRDGYDDLVISAHNYSDAEKRVGGKVFIYMGKPDFDGKTDFSGVLQDPPIGITGVAREFGTEAQIADVNGDGYPDLIVGSSRNYLNRPGEMWKRLHIYRGGPNFTFESISPSQLIESRRFDFGDIAKWHLDNSSIIDVNDDGLADVFVTHQDWAYIEAFVFLSTQDSIKLYPEVFIKKPSGSDGIWAGPSLKPLGDINRDSRTDFSLRVAPTSYLVYYQGPDLKKVQNVFARSGPAGNLSYGLSVANVGDQNGDGVDDICVSSSNANTSDGGAIILAGNKNLPVGIEMIDKQLIEPWQVNVYPNPFHSRTTIRIVQSYRGISTLNITDAFGREVHKIHDGILNVGEHFFSWDGRNRLNELLPSGAYFFNFVTQYEITRGPILLVK